jgi:hypothetical protein
MGPYSSVHSRGVCPGDNSVKFRSGLPVQRLRSAGRGRSILVRLMARPVSAKSFHHERPSRVGADAGRPTILLRGNQLVHASGATGRPWHAT